VSARGTTASFPDPPVAGGSGTSDGSAATPPARSVVPDDQAPPAGRARSFRKAQEQRRAARNERVGVLVVILIILLGVVTIVTARPYFPGSGNPYPTPGPPIVVSLGTPVSGTVACGAGGTAFTERIAWINSTKPVGTGDVNMKVYEIFDGDFVGDPGAVANATATTVCAGVPPTSSQLWYLVLATPNGTNSLTYTVGKGWLTVSGGTGSGPIADGSFLTLVTAINLTGTGRGLAVVGSSGGSAISGSVPL